MEQDPDTTIHHLAEGFSALGDEYRSLAQQHELLERKLAYASAQVKELRQLLPSSASHTLRETSEADGDTTRPCLRRNLDEWLQHMLSRSVVKDQEVLGRIHRGQLAQFKLGNRSSSVQSRSRRSVGTSRAPSRAQSRAPSHPTIPEDPMEQDFTEARTPGELGCPFATRRPSGSGRRPSVALHTRDVSTPQSSSPLNATADPHSRRASFVDPLQQNISAAEPLEDPTGPACPIRFLDQHSPEEVAKYFEEHKHELPRSHEVCVKRFQANDEIVRRIDEKYGNLVTMIQGLGKKHQPMLPEVPNPDAAGNLTEDQEVDQRVKNWAASVSGIMPSGAVPNHSHHDTAVISDVVRANDEERISHFDRPFKEIRLGESPSRPWGVPIPPKYLDKDNISDISSNGAAPPRNKVKPTNAAIPTWTSDIPALLDDTPKSKCPFDHRALMSKTAAPTPIKDEPSPFARHTPTPHLPSKPIETEQERLPRMINHGVAVISGTVQLPIGGLENRGVLIMGYSAEAARHLMSATATPETTWAGLGKS